MGKEDRRGSGGSTLLLHGANLDGTTRRGLSVFFDSACRGRFCFGDGEEAHVGIIDLDAVNGGFELSRYQQLHPGRPVVALGSNAGIEPPLDVVVLPKPLRPHHLRRVLDQHAERRSADERSAPPDAATRDPYATAGSSFDDEIAEVLPVDEVPALGRAVPAGSRQVLAAPPRIDDGAFERSIQLDMLERAGTYDPASYLQGAVHSARECARDSGEHMEVELRGARVVIGPCGQLAEMHCTPTQLRLAATRPGRATVRRARSPLGSSAASLVRTERLLWNLAIWSSQGRMPAVTDISAPLRLRHWPDLPGCSPVPGAVEMCALLSRTSKSVVELVEHGHDAESVILVHSALRACDLVEETGSESISAPAAAPVPRRGLLRRIVDHLRAG